MSDQSRRKLLKSIAAGSGAIVAGKSLPETWRRPVVDSVLLPAHAQTSGNTLSSTGVIAGLGLNTDSNTMMARQDGLLDSLIPSAHAASCSVEGKCASATINGNSGTLTVNGVGSSPFTLDGTSTANGTVGGIPFKLSTNAERTTGTLTFQGDCVGYSVLLGINASCTEVAGPALTCVGDSLTITDGVIIITYDGVTSPSLIATDITNRNQDTFILVSIDSNMSIGRWDNWSPTPASVELNIPDGTYTRRSTRETNGPIGDEFEVTFCVSTSGTEPSNNLTVTLVSMVKI